MGLAHRVAQHHSFGKLGEFAATLTKGAHVEVEASLSSRERTIETNDGALTIRTFSVKAESIRKLDRAESASNQEVVASD